LQPRRGGGRVGGVVEGLETGSRHLANLWMHRRRGNAKGLNVCYARRNTSVAQPSSVVRRSSLSPCAP
jgi:hypothetical protein